MTEHLYSNRVDAWIDEVLSKRRLSLNQLIRALPGVHPDTVAAHVRGDIRVADASPARATKEPLHELRFQVPHPLDFDWRFVESSRQLLLNRTLAVTGETDQIVLLGAPTVFRAALERDLPRIVTLVDASGHIRQSQVVSHARQVFARDVTVDELPELNANVVITDPPWYEEYMRAFLWGAASLAVPGGTVLLSAPPLGTRPGIEEEWSRTRSFAEDIGLKFLSSEPVLRYQMPPFEKNALRAAGQPNIDHDWRSGVLCTFVRKDCPLRVVRPVVDSDRNNWLERSMAGVRIRVRRRSSTSFKDPRLVSLIGGDVLDSVSRRDSRRNQVDVWTSGNRIFGCRDTEIFLQVLAAVERCTPAVPFVESSMGHLLTSGQRNYIANAEAHVIDIVRVETEEYVRDWEG